MTNETIESIEIGGTLPAILVHELLAQLVNDGIDAIDVILGEKLEASWVDGLDDGFNDTENFCVEHGLTFRQQTVYCDGVIVLVRVWEPGMDRPDSYCYLGESIVLPLQEILPRRVERVRALDRLVVPPLTLVEPDALVGFV